MRFSLAFLASVAMAGGVCAPASALQPEGIPVVVFSDPPRNDAHPARNRQLLIQSHGQGLNGLFMLAAGEGKKPTMLLLHGLPGNERNLDLAQAVRRAGWNVLTFTYRGAWGSPGSFTMANAIEDAGAALAFLRSPEAARDYNVDASRIVIAGHSMGGLAAALQSVRNPDLAGLVLLDAWNAGASAAGTRAAGAQGREALEAAFDDLGNSLVGATPSTIVTEVLAHEAEWDLRAIAPQLAAKPLLTVYAAHGLAAENRALAEAVGRHGRRMTVKEINSDHAFADSRIALAAAVVRWLQALPEPSARQQRRQPLLDRTVGRSAPRRLAAIVDREEGYAGASRGIDPQPAP